MGTMPLGLEWKYSAMGKKLHHCILISKFLVNLFSILRFQWILGLISMVDDGFSKFELYCEYSFKDCLIRVFNDTRSFDCLVWPLSQTISSPSDGISITIVSQLMAPRLDPVRWIISSSQIKLSIEKFSKKISGLTLFFFTHSLIVEQRTPRAWKMQEYVEPREQSIHPSLRVENPELEQRF